MIKYFFITFSALLMGTSCLRAQDKSATEYSYCKCIQDYSYEKHGDDFRTSGYTCYRAWKKDMKRKKKECQARALESSRPMAARRKRREAERKVIKRDKWEQEHAEKGEKHDYWY
jgi:hypothetical protein